MFAPVDEHLDRIIDQFRGAAVLEYGDVGPGEFHDVDLHSLYPFSGWNAILLIPRLPFGFVTKLGRRLPEHVLESAGKRFRIFKTGFQGNIDDAGVFVEHQPKRCPPQPHQLDVAEHVDPGIITELPMEVVFGKIRHLVDIIEHPVESLRVGPCR